MAIYPDKNAKGDLTGKFRVELQMGGKRGQRYRERHATLEGAKEDEERVKALWGQGAPATRPAAILGQSVSHTLAQGIQAAKGILWRGSSNETCNFAHLNYWEGSIGPDTPLGKITSAQVLAGTMDLERAGKANGTINRYLSQLRTFLVWAERRGLSTLAVGDLDWGWLRETKGRLRWLSFAEEDKLISLVPENIGKLIKVALATGCRREELLSAKANQVDDDAFHIWKSKNDETRTVPVTPETAKLLRELIAEGMPTARTLRRRWDAAKVKMGLQDDAEFVFHTCRHTCATRMVDADIDILLIKAWLGHKRIETTQRYAKVKPKKLHSVLARVGDLRAIEARETLNVLPFPVPQASPKCGGFDPIKALG